MVRRFKFEKTCNCIPEQYDIVTLDGFTVGYIHLRHGLLTACIRSAGNHDFTVYSHTFKNEIGKFADEKQREKYLSKIEERLKVIMV